MKMTEIYVPLISCNFLLYRALIQVERFVTASDEGTILNSRFLRYAMTKVGNVPCRIGAKACKKKKRKLVKFNNSRRMFFAK